MTELRKSVGDRIRAIRKAKGLTQQQLAELSNLDDAYIGSLERGERNFSIDTLEKVIMALKIHAADLFPNDSELSETEIARRKAIDEYMAAVSGLNVKQIDVMKRVVKEVRGAYEV